ncbi:cob(I)yrinic acid a,c-diamide adenosyltransferase [Acidisoma cellulosilytica]|uniref:Corrinoid adenosyltransferase n=1 Tax=Acidisoma cellulosilyticum TaxID=2802395 RepID=A0A963Z1H0_9PROT|nr:cob(I)yrinic acid a,c-diamide adenosyltransferase [Acidisoma cellulosilyticum]MCB8880794.1 cob(I)yrinic acid a,c-diamide adenosyltransferase [Acidisoma cellulosilyticum]
MTIRIDRVVTRGGDEGMTSLGTGARVRKDALRVEAFGTVDEANAAIGLIRLHTADHPTEDAMLGLIQNDLFDLGADLCAPEGDEPSARSRLRIEENAILRLEAEVEAMNADLPPLTSFVLPGGTPAAAFAHLARTITRRAERLVVALAAQEPVNPLAIRYLNRLSDHLFVLSRALNAGSGREVAWVPGGSR